MNEAYKALKSMRELRGHSLNTVAKEMGWEATTLRRYEIGTSKITLERFVQLVEFYNFRIDLVPTGTVDVDSIVPTDAESFQTDEINNTIHTNQSYSSASVETIESDTPDDECEEPTISDLSDEQIAQIYNKIKRVPGPQVNTVIDAIADKLLVTPVYLKARLDKHTAAILEDDKTEIIPCDDDTAVIPSQSDKQEDVNVNTTELNLAQISLADKALLPGSEVMVRVYDAVIGAPDNDAWETLETVAQNFDVNSPEVFGHLIQQVYKGSVPTSIVVRYNKSVRGLW